MRSFFGGPETMASWNKAGAVATKLSSIGFPQHLTCRTGSNNQLHAAYWSHMWLAVAAAVAAAANAECCCCSCTYDCERLAGVRLKLDRRDSNGGLPAWAFDGPLGPHPPWIVGGDDDNLLLTRQVQRDLWVQQHPVDCFAPSVRMALLAWPSADGHGIGSQIHMISGVMSAVVKSGRVLVLTPTFERARHAECEGDNQASLDCYFWPATSADCTAAAMQQLPSLLADTADLDSEDRFVLVGRMGLDRYMTEWDAADRWLGHDTASTDGLAAAAASVEVLGKAYSYTTEEVGGRLSWWRAQTVRFLLRWPSRYLCRLCNRARHRAFGRSVARQLSHSMCPPRRTSKREAVVERRDAFARLGTEDPASKFALSFSLDLASAVQHGLETTAWVDAGAYMPRPIVSIYVRQGDKWQEAELFSLDAHLQLAERLRLHDPGISHAWLGTEMQSVVDAAKVVKGWTVFATEFPRLTNLSLSVQDYEQSVGLADAVGNAFVNLVIASECCYFIGTLASNWNRLINELRLTGGKLKRGFLTLDYSEG
eukprot:SM000022S07177  [mRNA]  locus=s22:287365:290115:- [translate_table: standard]